MATVPRKAYVDVTEGQIHYAMVAGEGTPVVFFHQTASSWQMWAKTMARIDGGWPMIAFDTPGFGGSFDPDGTTSMPRYAGWMAEAMAMIGISHAHVVGHHTGAAIAAELAAARPDLCASVTLIGPLTMTAGERDESAKHYGPAFRPEPTGGYLMDNWAYLRVGGAAADPLLIHREMADMLRAYAARPQAYNAVWAQDFDAAFRAIGCPLQIACAPDDVLWSFFERARAMRPDATATVLPGGANFEPDLDPDAVADAVTGHVRRNS